MQTKLKRNKFIQNFILIIILLIFTLYILYTIYVSILNNQIKENINSEELLSLKIIVQDDDLKKIYENPTEEEYISVDVTINGKTIKNCGLRTKGSTSYEVLETLSNPTKFGYRLDLDYFIDDQSYDGISKFYINNGILDKTYIKEMIGFDIYEKAGVKTPKKALCEVSINETNQGIYTLVEVADTEFIERTYGDSSGIIYKPKIKLDDTEECLVYTDDDFNSYTVILEGEKFGKTFTRYDMKNLIESLKMVSKNENLEEYVDIDSTINYFVGSFFIPNDDSFISPSFRNFYIYQNSKKITLLPYDLNLYFRFETSVNAPILFFDTYNNNPENKPLIYNILNNSEYQEQYKEKMVQLVEKIEQEDFLNKRIDLYANLIDESIRNNPNNFYDYEEFKLAIDAFKRVFGNRLKSVKKQLEVNENYAYIEYEEEIGQDIYLIGDFYKNQ